MAKMIDVLPQYKGEQKVWNSLKEHLSDDIVVYNTREIKGKELDFFLLIENIGILIIEVKGWLADKVKVETKDKIIIEGYRDPVISPKSQSRSYRFTMLNKLNEQYGFKPVVFDMVCFPFISEKQYYDVRLDVTCEPENVIFSEDLQDSDRLLNKIKGSYELLKKVPHEDFDHEKLMRIRRKLEPTIDEDSQKNDIQSYSILSLIPYSISTDSIANIANSYFEGIKRITFFGDKSNYEEYINQLDSIAQKRNLSISSHIKLGYENLLNVLKNQNDFNIFNNQTFYVESLDSYVKERIDIENGQLTEEYEKLLQNLVEPSHFNLQQYKVEHANDQTNTLVEAGAGTGKTFSMISRVAYLCNKKNNPIENIEEELAMITFTNDAADNMKERLKLMFTDYFLLSNDSRYLQLIEQTNRARISTIHKFVISILQNLPAYTGLGTRFKISNDPFLRNNIYENYLSDLIDQKLEENPDFINQMQINLYDLKKNIKEISDKLTQRNVNINNIDPTEYGTPQKGIVPYMNDVLENVIKPSENEYNDTIGTQNRLDLKNVIMLLNDILKIDTEVIKNIGLRYIFIDEFQDTDDIQIELFQRIQKAIGPDCKFFVVGDLKQSIYRFRGATMSSFNLMQEKALNKWDSHYLNINYRTNKLLISQMNDVFVKVSEQGLLPYEQKDQLVSFIEPLDHTYSIKKMEYDGSKENDQFDQLAEIINNKVAEINDHKSTGMIKGPQSIAILARSNWQIREIKDELSKRGISVEVDSEGDLFQLESTIDLYYLLQALVYCRNSVELVNFVESNYINVHIDYQKYHEQTEAEIVKDVTDILNGYFTQHLGKSWEDVIVDLYTKPILYVLKQIYDHLMPWKNYSREHDDQLFYMSNYSYLLERIVKYSDVDNLTVNDILEYLRINIITEQKVLSRDMNKNKQGLSILCRTVHKSKGLEYDTVILPYTEDALIQPNKIKTDAHYINNELGYVVALNKYIEINEYYDTTEENGEQLKEETRILYVAMTRAKNDFIWLKDSKKKTNKTWSEMLGGQ